MTFPMPPPALPSGLPEPREALPVESADECSDSDDCDDFHDPDDWDGQPWEVVFPSDSPLLAITYESSGGLFDALKGFCIENRMGLITLRSQKDKAKTRTIKYELVCDKSRYNPRESSAKIRSTTTTKLAANCPFKIIVQSLQTNNYEWSMRIMPLVTVVAVFSEKTSMPICYGLLNNEQVKWWKKANGSLDSDMDDDQDNADAADVQELERGNIKVKDMKNAKLGPLPKQVLNTRASMYLLWRYMREWACYYTRYYRNFGLITAAPAESNHHSLKTYHLSLRSDLPDVEAATASQTDDKRQLYKDKIQRANTTIRNQFSGREWLGQLPLTVTRWALDQLDEIRRLMESSEVSKKMLPPCTGSTKTQYGLPCAHRLLELALQDEPLKKEGLDTFWHTKRSRDIDDPLLQIKRPPMGIPKGRPRNSEPFGNERAIPEQEFAPQGSTRSGVQRSARWNYSQFELGPTLDEEDAADLHDQQLRRKRRKVAVSVTTQAARQQAKREEDTNKPIERHIALEVEENPEITESSPAKETGKEKVGDSITVATD
ncbi:hypothetical protein FOBRF1_013534 [Fusarium oxysporum]